MKAAKAWSRRCAIWLLLSLPFLAVFLLVSEAWLRFTTNLPYVSRTHCFTQNELEAPGFKPDCSEALRTPGGTVRFRTNEDGFRDRPRAFFAHGAVAVLGDSYVEGFWLDEERGPVRKLEEKLGGKFPLLNLGIRGTGPSQQAIRFYRAAQRYPLRAVIWFLNPSDPIDERYFLARNPGFSLDHGKWSRLNPIWSPPPSYWWWTNLSLFFHDRIYLLIYIAEKWIKQEWQARLTTAVDFQENLHCRSLIELARDLHEKKLPLVFVATPHGLKGTRRQYLGVGTTDTDFERMLTCARSTGAVVADVRHELENKPELYWANDWHFNESGAEALANDLALRLHDAFPAELR